MNSSHRGLSSVVRYSRMTFRSFAGLEVSEFDCIYAKVEPRYEEFERKRLSRADRKHDVGAGRPFKLSLRDRLLMLLVYYRTYITSTLAAFLFDLDQSNVLKDCLLYTSPSPRD